MTRNVARSVPGLDGAIPIYVDGQLEAYFVNDKFVPATPPKPEVKRIPVGQRRLYYRDREYEEGVTCYFIGGESGPVKIGFTENLPRRLRDIQAHSPIRVSVLATTGGGIFAELAYHERFAEHRLHGEWFARCPDILAEIARLSSPQARP